MGRTIPSYRLALEHELTRWQAYRHILPKDERPVFDDLLNTTRHHASAASYSLPHTPLDGIFLTLLLHHHQRLHHLRAEAP